MFPSYTNVRECDTSNGSRVLFSDTEYPFFVPFDPLLAGKGESNDVLEQEDGSSNGQNNGIWNKFMLFLDSFGRDNLRYGVWGNFYCCAPGARCKRCVEDIYVMFLRYYLSNVMKSILN